jgi:hypothetical protein
MVINDPWKYIPAKRISTGLKSDNQVNQAVRWASLLPSLIAGYRCHCNSVANVKSMAEGMIKCGAIRMQERGIYVACMAGFSRGGDQLGEFQAVVNIQRYMLSRGIP